MSRNQMRTRINKGRRKTPVTLHCIPQILRRERISIRQAASRMGVTTLTASKQVGNQYDLSLSELDLWREALRVPVSDLLTVPIEGIYSAIRERAKLVQIMKTVRTLQRKTKDDTTEILVNRLASQLMELMPELDEVLPWPNEGKIRKEVELGKVAERVLPREVSESLDTQEYP